ncbi:hypothetical protein acdb102_18340 [Acidothermaceae bacterium B102]|nr:hypothetical protein acdb102_18340 [Acidothermaceae bacterium B102]
MLAALLSPVTASADTPPTATVVTPSAGGQVAGFVTVTLAGTVDLTGGDSAQRLQLYVDNVYKGEQSCLSLTLCAAAITWDTTTLIGQHTLQARLVTAQTSVKSAVVTVQVGDMPTAYTTSPADGSSVRGKVTVSGGGTLDALQPDGVQSLQLLVDGTSVATLACSGTAKACAGSLVWNSTGVQGAHELQLAMSSVKGQSAVSPVVNVTTNNPVPVATLSSPTAQSTVRGTVTVSALGVVDPTQVDVGATVQLVVDGSVVGSVPCTAMSCPAKFAWNTAGKAGTHTLQALFSTAGGRTATSTPTTVWVFSPSTVTLAPLPVASSGATVTASGRVTGADGNGVAGAKVVVSVTNSLGRSARKVTLIADPTGRFAVPYTVVSNTTVTAAVAATTHYGSATATTKGGALAVVSCSAGARVVHNAVDKVVCQLGGTTRGTALTLEQLKGASWQTIASAKSSGTTWTWPQVFRTKGTFQVRVLSAASKDFGGATSNVMRVAVS